MSKIFVLGGSFNPPAEVHLELVLSTIKCVNADFGIFVPAPFDYVQRKLRKTAYKHEAIAMMITEK